jgi:hypothetical protein
MKLKNCPWRTLPLLAILALTGCGCFTHGLWQTDEFRHWREPATNAAVAVYYSPARQDYLVGYNALRDGGDDLQRQYYFLGAYESRRAEKSKPRLVSPKRLKLVPVPLNSATNPPCAHFDKTLTIHTPEGTIGPCPLPTYVETDGTLVKTALTPVTVLGDITCVSLFVGLIGLYAYAGGGGTWSCD